MFRLRKPSYIAEARSYIAEATSYITEARSYIAETRSYIAEARSCIAEVKSYIVETTSYIAEARSYIAEARSYITEVRSYIAEVRSYIAEDRSYIAEVRSNIAEGRNYIAEATSYIAEARNYITEARSYIVEVKSYITVIESKYAIPSRVVKVDKASVLVEDDKGRRWRLPLGDESFTAMTDNATLRICREVATERDLFNCHGTFYELPAENADGYAKIRPVSSHNLKIHDYASFRGMLIMTGIDLDKASKNPEHIFTSTDKKAAVWAGVIDDLWKLGKPTGKGGPWFDSSVKTGVASDPYLIGFYDKKALSLSHDAKQAVSIRLEVDPGGDGNWMEYQVLTVKAGEKLSFEFPKEFQARWIRFVADHDCKATALLTYR